MIRGRITELGDDIALIQFTGVTAIVTADNTNEENTVSDTVNDWKHVYAVTVNTNPDGEDYGPAGLPVTVWTVGDENNIVLGYGNGMDLEVTFTPDEARTIGRALIGAADMYDEADNSSKPVTDGQQ